MDLKLKSLLVFVLAISSFTSIFAQTQDKSIEINSTIEYSNSLIWHINYNIKSLKIFQADLKAWTEDSNRTDNNRPQFVFITNSAEELSASQKKAINNKSNYHLYLNQVENQILKLNSLCKEVEKLSFLDESQLSESDFLYRTNQTITAINNHSLKLAETVNNFSIACASSFEEAIYPVELTKVEKVVFYTKSLILAIRNNDIDLMKGRLASLSASLDVMKNTTNVPEIHRLAQSGLSIEELYALIIAIYDKANNISEQTAQILQAEYTKDQANLFLLDVISEFNEAEGKLGCASGFNTMLKYSVHNKILFTEEPNSIIAEKIVPVKKVEKEIVELKTLAEVPVTIEAFDIENINTLMGSKANNLILLIDVSVSMKRSEKLPILKNAITHFLDLMRTEDKVSLIAYSGKTQVLISGASKKDRNAILDTLSKVHSSGGSDVYQALQEAYSIGKKHFIANGNNKIIIASDGIFGIDYSTLKYVKEKAVDNFSLSVFQFSHKREEVNFKALKNLAATGNGAYEIIYNEDQAINAMMHALKKQLVLN